MGWWGGVVEYVTTMSNSNASCFRVELSCVALGFDKILEMSAMFVDNCHYILFSYNKDDIIRPLN